MSRYLAKACAVLGALSICSCSLLLDWNSYTGGNGSTSNDAETPARDATVAEDADDANRVDDATADVTLGTKDAQDARGSSDVTMDVADAQDDADLVEQDGPGGPPPTCSPTSCGGCCIPSSNYCAFGNSSQTCGVGGLNCQDCTRTSDVCVNGVCTTPQEDAGTQAPCVVSSCARTLPPRCIPFWQMACCRQDNSCGCQIMLPPGGPCL